MQTDNYMPLIEGLLNLGVTKHYAECFAEGATHRSYQAKDDVFVEGDSHPYLVFILSGYMRLYVTDQDGEISTRLLAGPGKFVGCIVSLLYGKDAQYTAECITDCRLIVVNKNTIEEAKSKVETITVLQDIVVRHLIQMIREKATLLPLKATDRYLYFRERYPELKDRIPAGILANYIGVRPQSLSRIKQMLR